MHLASLLQFRDTACFTPAARRPSVVRRVQLATGAVIGRTLLPRHGEWPLLTLHRALAVAIRTSSTISLACPGGLDHLHTLAAQAFADARLDPRRLELSFNASQVTSCGVDALLALSALRDLGPAIALSGVRAAHAPLLRRLPLTTIILDPLLVASIPGSAPGLAELNAIAELALPLGLAIVAAGVETEAQRAVLSGLGAGFGEGELFGMEG